MAQVPFQGAIEAAAGFKRARILVISDTADASPLSNVSPLVFMKLSGNHRETSCNYAHVVSKLVATEDGTPLGNGQGDSGVGELKLGNLSIDLATFKVTVDTLPANLTYLEFELLCHLTDFRDRIVSFDLLSGLLWGSKGPKETRRLNVLVWRLRSKLTNSFPYQLETVRGRGYGLLGGGGWPAQGK